MLIDLFIPTGEVRKVKPGEYSTCEGGWEFWPEGSVLLYPIGIRHQIEVPDDAEVAIMHKKLPDSKWIEALYIPRPKKKVKKWNWIYKDNCHNFRMTVAKYATKEEVSNVVIVPLKYIIEPYLPSEIEVDE